MKKKQQKNPSKKETGKKGRELPKFESVGYPRPLYGDVEGSLYDIPGYRSLGRKGIQIVPLEPQDLLPLNKDIALYSLPSRKPMLWKKDEIEILPLPMTAVGAVLPEGYILNALSAFDSSVKGEEPLPPLAYGALTCWQNQNWVAASRVKNPISEELPEVHWFSYREKLQKMMDLPLVESLTDDSALIINYVPGVSNSAQEMEELVKFLESHQPKQIRMVNGICQWEDLFELLTEADQEELSLSQFIKKLGKTAPDAEICQVVPYWKE